VILIRNLVSIIVLILSQNCFATESITLAVENSWPPYSDQNGNGISKNIIEAAYNAMNVEVNFIAVPYSRALRMAEHGQVDGAFNVTKQESTIEKFNFGEVPILQTTASFYYHKDSTINFTSTNEIPNTTSVGVIIGYEYGNNYEKNRSRFKEVAVANQEQLIQLLKKRRIEVAIMFDEIVKNKLENMGLHTSDIRKGKINHKSDIYVAFSKSRDTKNAIKLLDEGLIRITQ
jgi:polar amino acid transport system substrate-binding protein